MRLGSPVFLIHCFFDLPCVLGGVFVLVAFVLPNVVGDTYVVGRPRKVGKGSILGLILGQGRATPLAS